MHHSLKTNLLTLTLTLSTLFNSFAATADDAVPDNNTPVMTACNGSPDSSSPALIASNEIPASDKITTVSIGQASEVNWKNVPTQFISAGGIDFAYRELGKQNGGTPIVFLGHLAAVLDNWDPLVVDGIAAKHHVFVFDNQGVGASSGGPWPSIRGRSWPRCRRCTAACRTVGRRPG